MTFRLGETRGFCPVCRGLVAMDGFHSRALFKSHVANGSLCPQSNKPFPPCKTKPLVVSKVDVEKGTITVK